MRIQDARVAVLLENQYQELELWYPVLRLREAGAAVTVVGPSTGEVFASKLGYPATADVAVGDVDAGDFDVVIVPGGFSPEYLRRNPPFVDLVRKADESGRTVAAICHAGWMLATAGIVSGRRVTSNASMRDDVINAGGDWVNEPVVVDGNLITSQLPNDLPLFLKAIIAHVESLPDSPRQADNPAGVSAGYESKALLKNRAAGPGSANYRTYAILEETG
ncbi:MAG: type 1 glutamine amidotransferase domain-containing protein [Kibdelosporangium sp.]